MGFRDRSSLSAGAIVIVGGGPAAVEALLALRASERVRSPIELVASEPELVYRPAAVAEPFGAETPQRFPLQWITALRQATFRLGTLSSVDAAGRRAHLSSGLVLRYDALLIAVGARAQVAIDGAVTFWGRDGDPEFQRLLADVRERGGELIFVVPQRVRWSLPLYEIALLSAAELSGREDVRLRIVTPEPTPLAVFGGAVSRELSRTLEAAGIEITLSADVSRLSRELERGSRGVTAKPSIVALPRLEGPRVGGLPEAGDGFLAVDDFGRVLGADGVYAAGDATDFPVKQGGLAAEQADSCASTIAADLGLGGKPRPLSPILRGRMLGPDGPSPFMSRELDRYGARSARLDDLPLWWPGAKLYGKHLAPFLAAVTDARSASRSGA